MAIDTLAYVKVLEAAGLDRQAAEAQAEAPIRHISPELATKADLDASEQRLDQRFDRLEQRLDQAGERLEHRIEFLIEQGEHRMTVRTFGLVLGIVGLMDSVLFVLLRVVK